MGVAVLQLYPVQDNRTGPQVIELLTKRIMNQGATQAGQFIVDCEVHQSVTQAPNLPPKNLYILHNSECPATVFSILEAGGKTVTLTSDTLFDLLMLKLGNVYKKKTTVESRGPRFEIKDFLVKIGSVSVSGVFKGILVEVEYCPGVVPNNCWGILAEFMQGFLGSCVPSAPPPFLSKKGSETYWPADTVEQYLEHFNKFRQTAGIRQ